MKTLALAITLALPSLAAHAQIITASYETTDVSAILFNQLSGYTLDGRAFATQPVLEVFKPLYREDAAEANFQGASSIGRASTSLYQLLDGAQVSVSANTSLWIDENTAGSANALGLASFGAISTTGALDFHFFGGGQSDGVAPENNGFNTHVVLVTPIGLRPFWVGDASAVSLLPALADWHYGGDQFNHFQFQAQGAQFITVAANALSGVGRVSLDANSYAGFRVQYIESSVPETHSLGLFGLGALLLWIRNKASTST